MAPRPVSDLVHAAVLGALCALVVWVFLQPLPGSLEPGSQPTPANSALRQTRTACRDGEIRAVAANCRTARAVPRWPAP
jgi:hypothetical protein